MLRGPVVVALGGNALAPEGKGTYAELKQNIKRSISFVPELLRKGIRTVIVSGSGPQVGALLLESELAKEKLPAMPLDVLDAQLEGWLGYLIQQEIRNELVSKNIDAAVVTIITQVLVDRKDIAFKNPTNNGAGLSKRDFNSRCACDATPKESFHSTISTTPDS